MKKKLIVAVTGVLGALVLAIPALAAPADVNGDRIPDRWEKSHDLSLKVDQRNRDQDEDGLRNMREYREGTNPREQDSDGDGVADKPECDGEHGEGGPQGPPPVAPPSTP